MNVTWLNALVDRLINTTVIICGDTKAQIFAAYQEQHKHLFGNSTLTSVFQTLVVALHPKAVYKRFIESSAEALEHLVYASVVYLLVCLGIYKLIFHYKGLGNVRLPWQQQIPVSTTTTTSAVSSKSDKDMNRTILTNEDRQKELAEETGENEKKRVLFVISHPDDECMFFGPLIYSLSQRSMGCQVYILCLSNGNFENQAPKRREELWRSCTHLGIPQGNIILVNATNLPDDPNVEWKTDAVANIILHTVECLGIEVLVTFDRDGVSQHPNHCAVYYAAASLCLANLLPKDCKFYALDSINIIRKYLSIFDIICTCFMSKHWCILNWQEASVVRSAMKKHESQMKWYRWLYISFSRYMFINSLREVNLSDVELEMQIHEN